MRFPVLPFLASLFMSALLSHLATTTTTALLHDSFATESVHETAAANDAAAVDIPAAGDDAAAHDAAIAVDAGHVENFRLVEDQNTDLRILSRKKRDITTIIDAAASVGFELIGMFGDQQKLSKLNDLKARMVDLANDVQAVQTQLNDFESKLTLILIKNDLNLLKNTVDHLKQTTIDNGKYGPSILFGHNQIPGRLRTLRRALDNFNRYMTQGHISFDQKPLVRWYFEESASTGMTTAFKKAMISHQLAGYEFLKILYITSCQQDNQDKPIGWCHADEAAKTTTEVTNLEKTRIGTQMKLKGITCSTMYTSWETENKECRYLDRHFVNCVGGALAGFKLERGRSETFRYKYRCCTLPNACRNSHSEYRRVNSWTSLGEGGLFYLDRQSVSCNNSPIKRFLLKTDSVDCRYMYWCLYCYKSLSCTEHSTKHTYGGDGDYGNTVFLDRQNVQCPVDSYMSKFRMHTWYTTRANTVNYHFTCCKF